MRTALTVIIVLLALMSGFAFGRFTAPTITTTETETQWRTSTIGLTVTRAITRHETLTSITRTTETRTQTTTDYRTVTRTVTTTVTWALSPPTDLRVTGVDYGLISLAWQDNSVDEEGFVVERSDDGQTFSAIGRTGQNAASYTDRTVQAERTYYYRVRAFRGDSVSRPSNTVMETATPHGLYITNYFGGLGELETASANIGGWGFRTPVADLFWVAWNWEQYPRGSRGAEAVFSIDFRDRASGAGSQKIVVRRTDQSGQDTTLVLLTRMIRNVNPAYAAYYPRPGDTVVFTFHYKTSPVVENLEIRVQFSFLARRGGSYEYLSGHEVLRTRNSSANWRQVTFSTVVPESAAAFNAVVYVTCFSACSGTVWLDGFVLRTEPVKRLPLIGRDRINFKLAAIHNEIWDSDMLELAQRMDLLLGGDVEAKIVKGLKPALVHLHYFNDPSLMTSRRNDSNRLFPCMLRREGGRPVYEFVPYYNYQVRFDEGWLLTNSTNTKYLRPDGRGGYVVREVYCEFLVDIGNPDAVKAAIASIEQRHVYAGFYNPTLSSHLFHDNFFNFYYLWGMEGEPPSKYPRREERLRVLRDVLREIKERLLDPEPKRVIIPNLGVFDSLQFQTLNEFGYDGIFLEYFTRIFGNFLDSSLLYDILTALRAYPEDRTVVLVDALPLDYINEWNSNPARARPEVRRVVNFVVAALYLVNGPNTYVHVRDDEHGYLRSYVLEDFYLPIGKPLGRLELVNGDRQGALFVRRFDNGIVLLNTAVSDRSFDYALDGQYRDRAGNVYSGRIVVPPQTGYVLIRAAISTSVVSSAVVDDANSSQAWSLTTAVLSVPAASSVLVLVLKGSASRRRQVGRPPAQ
ncbi:MAG: fibronectin type III domain-containing protein [Thaumarchaeota archaeon]|nr:fibronectin type III domain-containing protein [Candidatus Calditenuaceae archaeon]